MTLAPAPGDMHAALKYAENKLYTLLATPGTFARGDMRIDAEKAYERVKSVLERTYSD